MTCFSTLRSYNYPTPPITVEDHILDRFGHWNDVPSQELDKAPTYIVNHCWWNSMANKDNYYSQQGKRLRLVFGTMSVEGKVLFGNENHTDDDWLRHLVDDKNERGLDAHCWLEDEEGNIYDKFFSSYESIACLDDKHRGTLSYREKRNLLLCREGKRFLKKAKLNEVYEGWSPKDLYNKRGVSYKPMGDKATVLYLATLLKLKLAEVYTITVANAMLPLIADETERLLTF
jgi:hypothetical protein